MQCVMLSFLAKEKVVIGDCADTSMEFDCWPSGARSARPPLLLAFGDVVQIYRNFAREFVSGIALAEIRHLLDS